jgi:hypothetical protein
MNSLSPECGEKVSQEAEVGVSGGNVAVVRKRAFRLQRVMTARCMAATASAKKKRQKMNFEVPRRA